MPCLRNLSISHALQYFDDDIKKRESKVLDYYSQEDSGVWFGKTAERLGLIDKQFSRNDYQNIMKGKFSYFDKNTQQIIKIDLTKNSKNGEHHAGIELTISAPKSVSIMAEIFKDKGVIDAHLNAINKTIDYIQDNFIYTRTSKNGKMELEKVDNLLATKFTHHTNRNHDPQLHTHVLIANIIIDKIRKVKTAEHTNAFENERFIRKLYYNELANNLIKLGYDIDWQKKITQISPEIKGIPQELNDFFSTRRKEIEKFAERHNINLENSVAMEFACLVTRQAKDNSIDIDELSPVWIDKAEKLGININQLRNLNKSKTIEIKSLKNLIKDSIEHLTERQTTFTKEQLISSIIDRSNGIYNVKQIQEEIKNNKELISNNINLEQYYKHLKIFGNREKTIYTTRTQIETENKILTLVENGTNKFKSITKIINNNGTYSTLNNNQKMTVDFILNNRDQFLAIQGYAGVGKTYTIKALNEKLRDRNITLIGLAPTHSAANTLKNETNIETNTLQSFLAKYDGYANDREINKNYLKNIRGAFNNKIILVDESSLISNRQMKNLLTIANKFNIRVILQGDKKQLDSVESGTPFHRLIDNNLIKYSELNNILRQRDETIKQAVYDIINKDIKKSLQKLKENNKIIELRTNEQLNSKNLQDNLYTDNGKINNEIYNKYLIYLENNNTNKIKKDLVNRVVEIYKNLKEEEKNKTLIITSSNEIRKEINKEIRNDLKLNNKTKSINIETLELKSLTTQEKKEIENYNINSSITFLKDNNKLNIKKDIEYIITNKNKNKNEITLLQKEQEQVAITINIQKQANNISLYIKEGKELIINDKIRFTITNKEKEISKVSSFTIKDIDNENNTIIMTSDNKNKKEFIINLNNEIDKQLIKHIDYNYTTTTYSSQGKTSQNVIYTLESYRPILTTQKDLYVGLSRTKDNITIITDNIDKSMETLISNTGEKIGIKDIKKDIDNNNDIIMSRIDNIEFEI